MYILSHTALHKKNLMLHCVKKPDPSQRIVSDNGLDCHCEANGLNLTCKNLSSLLLFNLRLNYCRYLVNVASKVIL